MSGQGKIDQRLINLLTPVIIAGVSFAAFFVTSPGGFLSDDFNFLSSAMTVNASNFVARVLVPHASWGFYRPVGTLYWLLCYKLFGTEPFGYWCLSVLMHAMNAYLVFVILKRLRLGYQGALAGAMVFAAFPLHGEAVAWLSCAFDRLCLMFVLAGTYAYIRYREGRRTAYYVLALASFVLALMSKEMAITFPALIFMVDMAMSEKWTRDIKAAFIRVLPFVLVASAYLAARYAVFHGMGGYKDASGNAIQTSIDLGVILYNLKNIPGMLLFPVNTLLLKSPDAVYGIILTVLALSVAHRAFFGGPALRYALLGLGWLVVAYLPAMTLYAAFPNLAGGRFSYMPLVGIAIFAGTLFGRPASSAGLRETTRAVLLAALVGCYVFVSFINYNAWAIAYNVAGFLPLEVVKIAPDPSKGSDMYFIGHYDNYDGAYVYRNGLENAINIAYGLDKGRNIKVHFMDPSGVATDAPSVNVESLTKGKRENLYIFYYQGKTGRLIPVYLPGKHA